ncbi:CotS family spore coat protein [Clostridium tarantellae]|uniref:CotS family spore coat protein n=1 Tax=Clostridium tarantellae TaxID=39493 RepID=A0A6I1MJ94_9CLOT|nr:CotS family spore coat protein [Clostridium tarantellae]MPQ43004.1 CotS family spore coat protein [Clostridium tarantellae]
MIKSKYSDEKYLCKYDLTLEFFDNLGVEVIDLWPVRNIYLLNTKQGKKILKIIDYDEERLNFICKSLSYISKNYKNILHINILPNKLNYIDWKGNKYILLDLIDGLEFNIANPIDLKIAVEGIAKMHKASMGILSVLNEKEKDSNCNLFNLKEEFQKNIDCLNKFKLQVKEYVYKNEFDKLFLKRVDNIIDEIKDCIKLLEDSEYFSLCKNKQYIVICHNDLAYHNILINDEQANFIDFDYCKVDLRVKDLANFIIKCIKKFGFSLDIYNNIIDIYGDVFSISKEELEILYILIKFPKDFCCICKEYYQKEKNWSYESFLSKFQNKLFKEEERHMLVAELKEKYDK